jgi:hypothetical protein
MHVSHACLFLYDVGIHNTLSVATLGAAGKVKDALTIYSSEDGLQGRGETVQALVDATKAGSRPTTGREAEYPQYPPS